MTRVQGLLVTTVLDRSPAGSIVAYRAFVRVWLSQNGQEAFSREAALAADLARVVFAEVDPSGRVTAVRLDPALDNLSGGFARSLVAAQQMVFPGRIQGRWQAEEEDPNGLALAVYEITGPGQIRKTKVRYLRSGPAGSGAGEGSMPIEPAGSVTGRFDRDGHLFSLGGVETLGFPLMGQQLARTASSLRLRLERRETVSPSELNGLRTAAKGREAQVAAVLLSDSGSDEEMEAALQRNELGTATLDSLLASLAHAEEGKEPFDEAALYLDLKALAFLRPESCPRLGAVLATASADGPTLRILAAVLAGAGHPDAQAALASAVRSRRHDSRALTNLLPTLGEVPAPTPVAEDVLWDLARSSDDEDISAMAQLALGTMAGHLSATSPGRALRIVDWASNRTRASSSQDRRLALLMLGNAASPRTMPVLIRSLDDPTPQVRAAAAVALAALPSPAAEGHLTRILATDRASEVRLEAARVLGSRTPTAESVRAQKAAFAQEAENSVRLVLLRNLAQAREAFPDLDSVLRRTADEDPSSDMREAAARLLAGRG